MAVPKVDGQFIAEAIKYIDENGDMTNVCEGTNVGFTQKYYRDRVPLTGDIHGIAPMIWCAYALTCNDL